MKLAWTKKLKTVVTCAAANNAPKRQLKQIVSKIERGGPRAAIIGLAISMGASNLLLIQDQRTPAGETVGNEPTTSKVSGTTETESRSTISIEHLPSAVSEPTVVVPSVSHLYVVKAGDTLSAIARLQDIPLKELVRANHLTTPDQLQINQRLTIPADYSSAFSQTIAVIRHPIHPNATTSLSAASGIGGGSDDEEQTEQKYYSQLPANQSINPKFRSKRKLEKLKLAIQKPRPTDQAKFPVSLKTRLITLPSGVNASKSPHLRQRQVSPNLPPLAAVDTYLPKPFDNSVYFKGYIWPTRGALTSGYGWRWGRMHKGIDIAAPIGTPIVAAAPGVVVKAGWNPGGYGKLVDIKHPDGTFTRYAHNNRILVQPGQEVEQGQLISEMGSTGRSTGPHLHFEMHPAGKGAVNPVAFLQR